LPKRNIIVAVTSDIYTDMRVQKVVSFLVEKGENILVVGRKTSEFELKVPFKTKRFRLAFNRSFLFYLEYNLRFFFFGLFKSVDLIVANDLDTLLACSLLAKIKRVPVIYDSHEYFTESVGLQGRERVRNVWMKLEETFLPKVSKAYTVSEPIASAYKEKYGVDFKLVRNFPSVSHFPVLKNEVFFPSKKVILYQGVFNPNRGLEETIKAMTFLDDEFLFVLAGYGELELVLKTLVHQLGLEKRVIFTGKLPYTEMMQYTYQAFVGIALEAPVGKSFEYSLPNKVFDYIHASLPFISLGTPEVRKIIDKDDVGVIINDNQPQTIADAIQLLADNSVRYNQLKENQRAVKHNYTWENETKVLDAVFFG
jgi:glycosyltransferase involved in cell wall biosynthesis